MSRGDALKQGKTVARVAQPAEVAGFPHGYLIEATQPRQHWYLHKFVGADFPLPQRGN